MADIRIKTADKVVPVIYAYTTPQIAAHDGWTKIGYSEQDTKTRVDQQTHTADVQYKIEWSKNATFDDGSGEIFHDTDFHAYLRKNGVEQKAGTEWFRIDPTTAKRMLDDFRENRGVLKSIDTVIPYTLRQEQDQAVREAVSYFGVHEQPEFLFNAKPRFGKTLSVYDLVKRMNLDNVLIVTNRPAIANSWYDDYAKFLGPQSGYDFVSEVDALKDKPLVLSRAEYIKQMTTAEDPQRCIEFISLQDLKGSIAFGGHYDKLLEVVDDDTSFEEAFNMADQVLKFGVAGISDLVAIPGLINLDLADVRRVMTKASAIWVSAALPAREEQQPLLSRLSIPLCSIRLSKARTA